MERATNSSLILYTTEDGLTKIEATFDRDTVWLSIDQMADLFQRNKSTISRHIGNIYKEGELGKTATVAKFATVQMEGERQVERQIEYYNLDVIISVGYRVKSQRGVQFRMWATAILKEFMKKGFVLDDDRLKNLGGGNYFDELLSRIRDIRSSEKVFWRKVLEIYATSIDYDPKAESTILFFKQVQNKMHWAAHQHTAAEVIYQRADAEKEHMGLTSWRGEQIHRADVEVAKNYTQSAGTGCAQQNRNCIFGHCRSSRVKPRADVYEGLAGNHRRLSENDSQRDFNNQRSCVESAGITESPCRIR